MKIYRLSSSSFSDFIDSDKSKIIDFLISLSHWTHDMSEGLDLSFLNLPDSFKSFISYRGSLKELYRAEELERYDNTNREMFYPVVSFSESKNVASVFSKLGNTAIINGNNLLSYKGSFSVGFAYDWFESNRSDIGKLSEDIDIVFEEEEIVFINAKIKLDDNSTLVLKNRKQERLLNQLEKAERLMEKRMREFGDYLSSEKGIEHKKHIDDLKSLLG
jgi:hypothetical protein